MDKTKKPITYRRLRGITFTSAAAGSGASGAEGRRTNRNEVSEDSGWVEPAREGKAVKEEAVVTESSTDEYDKYKKEEKQHKHKEHVGEMGALAAGAFALVTPSLSFAHHS